MNRITSYLISFIIISISIIQDLRAQETNIDSMIRVGEKASHDSVRANIYYELARSHYANKSKEALKWAEEGKKYYGRLKDTVRMTRCMNLVAVCQLILNNPDEAIRLHFEVLRIREKNKDSLGMAETYLNIGNVFYRGYDRQQAIKYFESCRKIALVKKNNRLLGAVNNNLGNYYMDRFRVNKKPKDFNLAIRYIKESIAYKEKQNEYGALEKTYQILANMYFDAGKLDQALPYTMKAEQLALKSNNEEAVGSAKMLIAQIYLGQRKDDLAKTKLEEFNQYVKLRNATHIKEKFASEQEEIWLKIIDQQVVNSDSISQLAEERLMLERQKLREELKTKYDVDKKNLEHQNLMLSNEAILEKAHRNKLLSMIFAVFVLIFGGMLIKLYKKNRQINLAAIEIRSQSELARKQNESLSATEQFKSKLFSIISHDLRTPLNSLQSLLMIHEYRSLPVEKMDTFLKQIQQELHISTSLLNDLLLWASGQMQNEKVELSMLNLSQLIQNCEAILSPQIRDKQLHVSLNIPSDLYVLGDLRRCEFIFRNILHNAIKYSPAERSIEIGSRYINKCLQIFIKDQGVGMQQERLEQLQTNQNFGNSTYGTRQEYGAGIGLALCKDFLDTLGWRLDIESTIGLGTTFYIFIDASANKQLSDHQA